jgi:hypothetical protein
MLTSDKTVKIEISSGEGHSESYTFAVGKGVEYSVDVSSDGVAIHRYTEEKHLLTLLLDFLEE